MSKGKEIDANFLVEWRSEAGLSCGNIPFITNMSMWCNAAILCIQVNNKKLQQW